MQGDRSSYKLNDFIADDSFKEWALGMTASDFWDNYCVQYPMQQPVVNEARVMLLSLRASQASREDEQVIEAMWDNISKGKDRKPRVAVFRPVFWRVAAAAAVLLICWVGYRFGGKEERGFGWQDSIAALSDMTEEHNTSGKPREIRLPDGSTITLENNSILKYDQDFNIATRTVFLRGKAFFDVAKNAEKPFIIHSNGLVTKVLGTSFTIAANEDDDDVTVSVVTGKVAVVPQDRFDALPEKQTPQLSGLVLTPNQKAVYSRETAHLAKTLVENPVVLDKSLVPDHFTFENTPVNEVFATLSRAYGITLVYDSATFEDCSLIVALEDESLYDKLRVICKTLNATYRVMGSEILIEGKGCKQ
jgi:ferric-dicitrate binding protein FerR (iron transport regulator)